MLKAPCILSEREPAQPSVTRRMLLVAGGQVGWMRTAGALDRGQARVLRFTFSRSANDRRTQWLIAVHTEVLRRLGLGFEFIDAPAGRGTLMVLSGEADGELGRTHAYAELYPKLLRLPEPNNTVEFAAYAVAGVRDPKSWEQAHSLGLHCEYRRGIYELQQLLERRLPAAQLSAISTISQGLRRLQLARTDLYFDVREAVDDFFRFDQAREEFGASLKLAEPSIVLRTTGHAYLSPAHADLVEPMSDTLRRMKAEGLVQQMLRRALDRP